MTTPPADRDDRRDREERSLAALLATFALSGVIVVAVVLSLAACGDGDRRAERPADTPPRSQPATQSTVAPSTAAPAPDPPRPSPSMRKRYAQEGAEPAPGSGDVRKARAVAQRFARGWLAYLAGRVPLMRLRDASSRLRDALAASGGRESTADRATATVTAVKRERARNPRALIATLRLDGSSYRRASATLAWVLGRWRVVDLRAQSKPRKLLARLPYDDAQVRIVEGGDEGDAPVLLVIPKRGNGEQAIRYVQRLIRRLGDDPGSYLIRFGGE